jgi:hypothetical protein
MPEVGLERSRVPTLIGKLAAATVTQHVRMNAEGHVGALTKTRHHLAKPRWGDRAAASSDTNICGPGGFSRCKRRNARSSEFERQWVAGSPLLARLTRIVFDLAGDRPRPAKKGQRC